MLLLMALSMYTAALAETAADPKSTEPSSQKEAVPQTENQGSSQIVNETEPESPVTALIKEGILPKWFSDADESVTRAELASAIVQALGLDQTLVNKFPFFRDVGRNHWAYAPIEALREKKVMTGYSGGFFKPDKPMNRQEVMVTLAKTLDNTKLLPGEEYFALENFADRDKVPRWARQDVAKVVIAGVVPKTFFGDPPRLSLNKKVSREETATYIQGIRTLLINQHQTAIKRIKRKVKQISALPVGVELTITPSVSLFREELAAGDAVFFATMAPMAVEIEKGKEITLPQGSRLRGRVEEIRDNQQLLVAFSRLRTADGKLYRMFSRLLLVFPQTVENTFVVPGQSFQIQTLSLPEMQKVSKVRPSQRGGASR